MLCRSVPLWKVAWAAFAGIALALPAAERQPEVPPVSYHVIRYTAEQGLPHNTVRALLQTRDGYLWVGTLAGLARFDGVKFTVFVSGNTPEMSSDAINALAEDRRDGSLWINTGKELLRYYQHRFERFDASAGYPHPFGELWPARQGGLWYSPGHGQLVLLQNRAVRRWELRASAVLGDRLMQVEETEGSSLLVLMYNGLYRFTPATGACTRAGPPEASDTSYLHFFKEADGKVLVASREGIWRGNESGWERLEIIPPGARGSPTQILPAGDGEYWIPWEGDGPPQLARFKAGQSEFVDLSRLPDYPMNRFLQDREGHLWLGTESGLCRLRANVVRVYAREQGLRNDFVKAVTAGPDGTIWLGTAGGVSGIKHGQVTNLPPVEPSNWGRAEGLLADRRGRVWYGVHYETVVAFDHGAWVSPADLSPQKAWLRTLYEDRSGRIWAGSDRGVAWLDEAGSVRVLPHTLSHPDVRIIHQDRRGDLWFGTYGGGLNRFHEGGITAYATALGEYNNRAWCIHEDIDGIFWVGSQAGLNRFVPPGAGATPRLQAEKALRTDPSWEVQPSDSPAAPQGGFFTFTTQHGLHENRIHNVQEDDFGYLWLSGPQGIYRVARRELNAVAAGRQAQAQVMAFGETDGMLNSQCNGGVNQPAGCRDPAGRLWFPTARGVAMIDPRTIRRNEVPPPVAIEQVRADDQVIFGDGGSPQVPRPSDTVSARRSVEVPSAVPHYQLAAGRARVVEFHYTGNSFAAPHRMSFKYRLEGYDPEWRFDVRNRRVAFYTGLRPGSYTFRVTACNNHGIWNEVPAEFSFTLAPYFWQTGWFDVLAVAAVTGLVVGVLTYRLRWQHRLLEAGHRQALADERTRISRDLHDDLGTALTGLALQIDVLRRDGEDGDTRGTRLAEAAAGIRALAERMREVVWAVNPRCDTVSSLASFLEQQAGQLLKADGPRCRFEFPEDIPALSLDGQMRHQLALGVREALSNAVRHARASEIVLGLRVERDQLIVRVADNGRGFCVGECRAYGRGLANLHARLEKIGGHCECHSVPGVGTTIELRMALNPDHSRKGTKP